MATPSSSFDAVISSTLASTSGWAFARRRRSSSRQRRRLRSTIIRLAAFDLDGTLVRGQTCVEAIAAAIGRADDCARFERLAMRDVTAVSAARETMAGWYERYSAAELTAPLAELELAPGSEAAFRLLQNHAIQTAIVSITWSFAVDWFARRLGADYILGTRLGPDGIEHVWPADKGPWLEVLIQRLSLERSAVAAVGDSDGDRELLQSAGLRFFVGDRPPDMPGLVHLPGGDMLDIARRMVGLDENGRKAASSGSRAHR